MCEFVLGCVSLAPKNWGVHVFNYDTYIENLCNNSTQYKLFDDEHILIKFQITHSATSAGDQRAGYQLHLTGRVHSTGLTRGILRRLGH